VQEWVRDEPWATAGFSDREANSKPSLPIHIEELTMMPAPALQISHNSYLQDHLGSTTALTGSSGTLIAQQQYEVFGINAGSVKGRYRYTGREQDELIGLTHYRERWYDPQQGRFLSEDP
jgi:uncharacterized protein RhaS with RHS repeats